MKKYNKHITAIWHSELTRSRETADIVAARYPDIPVQGSHLLNEVTMNQHARIEVGN